MPKIPRHGSSNAYVYTWKFRFCVQFLGLLSKGKRRQHAVRHYKSVFKNDFLGEYSENASTKRKMFSCGQGERILYQQPRSQHRIQLTRRANSSMADDLGRFNEGFSCFWCRFNFFFIWTEKNTCKLTINMCFECKCTLYNAVQYTFRCGQDLLVVACKRLTWNNSLPYLLMLSKHLAGCSGKQHQALSLGTKSTKELLLNKKHIWQWKKPQKKESVWKIFFSLMSLFLS